MTPLHRLRTHPEYVEGCFGCRAASLQFGTVDESDREYRFQQRFAAEFHNGDREAYRRLRQQGYQPPRIAGSRELETRASTRYEIETGRIAHNQQELGDVLSICEDSGFNPLAPSTAPVESP